MWVDWFEKKEVVDEEMMIGIVVGTMSMVNHPLYFKWALAAAKQGDADGQTYAGDCYERGCGVEPNDATAFEWYMKAAEQDDGEAHAWGASNEGTQTCRGRSQRATDISLFNTVPERPHGNMCWLVLNDLIPLTRFNGIQYMRYESSTLF